MSEDQIEHDAGHGLEGGETVTGHVLDKAEERQRLARIGQGDKGRRLLDGLGEQLEDSRRDDPERALRANE